MSTYIYTTLPNRHLCTSSRSGAEITFTCPLCDFVRTFNYMTGNVATTGGDQYTLHDMHYAPVCLDVKEFMQSGN